MVITYGLQVSLHLVWQVIDLDFISGCKKAESHSYFVTVSEFNKLLRLDEKSPQTEGKTRLVERQWKASINRVYQPQDNLTSQNIFNDSRILVAMSKETSVTHWKKFPWNQSQEVVIEG